MTSTPHDHDQVATPEELAEQNAELLPNREAMSVLDGPLKGPMPMDGVPFEPLAPGSAE